MASLRRSFQAAGFSDSAIKLLLASWRGSTSRSYDSAWALWESWCSEHQVNSLAPPLSAVLGFLAKEFADGKSYSSLNVYRSALSSSLPPVEGFPVGSHPTVSRLLKGAFHLRPSQPKYSSFWSVDQVLTHIKAWGSDTPLQRLSWKLAMLLDLDTASRSSDLFRISSGSWLCSPQGVTLMPCGLAKQNSAKRPPSSICLKRFSEKILCPVSCLEQYVSRTSGIRGEAKSLFIGVQPPHKPVASSTLARWLRSTLESAGVDTSLFAAHSTRGAAATKAAMNGLPTHVILKSADWSSANTFRKFYYRSQSGSGEGNDFAESVLLGKVSGSGELLQNHVVICEPKPSDIQLWNC